MRKAAWFTLPGAVMLAVSSGWADETVEGERDFQQAVKDAWIDGRLEAAYTFNQHLNPFAINTDVENGVVTLTGRVESDIDRDLAAEIAQGLDGVVVVDNRLMVGGEREYREPANESDARAAEERRSFGQWVNDATTSAAVKAALIGNDNIRARSIDVETRDDIVTLRGVVSSEQESELAEQLARNHRDVREVRNQLEVRSSG